MTVEVSLTQDEADRIEREARADGRSDWAWRCQLTDTGGDVVCVTENRYQLRRHRP